MKTMSASRNDLTARRADFPILHQEVHGKPLVYLDSAASSQKPLCVIDRIRDYYLQDHANIHRGIHALSERATSAYEQARHRVQTFLGAADSREIIFTRGTTESINLVAAAYGRPRLSPGDSVIITEMEHHSNLVPWQELCRETGATLRVVPFDENGELILSKYRELLDERTRIVALTHTSNSLGTVNPVAEMVEMARQASEAVVVVDGAQWVPHGRVDVRELDCDFYAFSGHKVYGPTGVGVLYGKLEHLESMSPYQTGGGMITSVKIEKTTFAAPPEKFEAGTPDIAGVVAMGTAVEYVEEIGLEAIAAHEADLLVHGHERLSRIDGLRFIGEPRHRAGVLSFVLDGLHPHDIAAILDLEGVAIRAGHHCTQPVMDHFGVPATVRASVGLYTNHEDLEALATALEKARTLLS